ncbi:MAG: hypothetical protein Kow00108_18010 [Calditrichia bacterium]
MSDLRKPFFSGKLYPSDKLNLEREIAIFLETAVQGKTLENPKGIILPHDGYRNTGGVIAKALTYFINCNIKNIIIFAPIHRITDKPLEIYNGSGYETPLGEIHTDLDLIESLKNAGIEEQYFGTEMHRMEDYSIEIILPFLQEVFGRFKILPILVGDISYSELSNLISRFIKADDFINSIFLSTVNLSKDWHYHEAIEHDKKVLSLIKSKQLVTLQKGFEKGDLRVCGIKAMSAMILAMHKLGYKQIDITSYRNSGDIEGNKEKTSGYFSAVLY